MNLDDINKNNTDNLDEKIILLLEKSNSSLPSTSLAILLNKPLYKIDKRLQSMRKARIIRKTTIKKSSYWKLRDDKKWK